MTTQATQKNPAPAPKPPSVNCLPIGTRLADFEITAIVGEGGFGVVYRAFDHSLRRTVAIKEYMPGALAGRGADKSVIVRSERHQETFEIGLKSFINEARLLAQFDHPALVKVHRFWEQNKTGYMAMRYYEGDTLKSIAKSNPEVVTEAWLKSILKPILEALSALYEVQILHRDISPDNIMIQKNGEAVLLDFGAARQIIGDMTQALTVILKPGYAPIEQYANDTSMKQGPWTDIYALSAVMYAAIVKKPPPTSVARMIKDPIESLQTGSYPGFSTGFLAAIEKGLAVRAEDRPQSIEEFRRLLALDTIVVTVAGVPGILGSTGHDRRRVPRIPSEDAAPSAAAQAMSQENERPTAERPAVGASVKPVEPVRPIELAKPIESVKPISPVKLATPLKPSTPVKPTGQVESAKPVKRVTARKTWRLVAIPVIVLFGVLGAYLIFDNATPAAVAKAGSDSLGEQASITSAQATNAAAAIAPAVIGSAPDVVLSQAAVPLPQAAQAEVQASAPAMDEETIAWEALKENKDASPKDLHRFMRKYPSGKFADLAKVRLADLKAKADADAGAEGSLADTKQGELDGKKVMRLISLEIKPWGTILVDGVSKGVSPPVKSISLAEGKHKIKVVNPGFTDYVTNVEVTKQKSLTIQYDFLSPHE